MDPDTLYSVSQVAILLKIHPLTVRRYIKEGKLRAVKVGGNVRVPQAAVNDFSQAIFPTSYSNKKIKVESLVEKFTLSDPIFRLKGRGLSLRAVRLGQ